MVMTDRFRNGDPSNDLDSRPGQLGWWQGGDLQGLIDELGYVKSLGMTAIWITPITEQTPGGYHGYWTLDFYTVDPHLGDMAKLQELVTKAHAIGLKIVLDVVINHTGYGHPWLTDPAHEGWFHDECAINYASQPSIESCWLAGLPDLNTENPAVRTYLTDWALWLIDQTHVDGFRLDTARHVPREFLTEWIGAIKRAHPEFWIVGEVYSSDYRYQQDYLDAGLDAVTDFQTYDSIRMGLAPTGDLSRLTWPPVLGQNLMPGHADQRATFLDNHDVQRFVGANEPDDATKARLEQAIAYLFTMPGTPVLYYGTEVALRGGNDPDNRRMMPWDDANADVRAFTTKVATLRRDTPVLRRGTFKELASSQASLVYERVLGNDVAVVAMNGSPTDPLELSVSPSDVDPRDTLQPELETTGASANVAADGGLSIRVPPRGVQVWLMKAKAVAPAVPPSLAGAAVAAAAGLAAALALVLGGAFARSRISRRA